MKKALIGAIVGGLLIFFAQTLSWTMLYLHEPAQSYTDKQDTIMQFLKTNLGKDGGYLLPSAPKGTSFDDQLKMADKMKDKPQISIQYHDHFDVSMNKMYMNMGRGLVSTIFMVWMVCWIIGKFSKPTFVSVFLTSLFIGLVGYINIPYNSLIWYHIFDARAYLIDAVLGWGLCGIWLGWWYSRR
jgi:hypothetical protein